MDATRETLLVRLKDAGNDSAWHEFDRLYRPFLRQWFLRRGLQHADADDLVQQTLMRARAGLPGFRRERNGSFRKWLGVIARNAHVDWARKPRPDALAPAVEAELIATADGAAWDQEHDAYLVAQLLDRVSGDFDPATFRAFRLTVLEETTPAEAAAACGLTVGAVYQAKARVLARLREEAGGFLE